MQWRDDTTLPSRGLCVLMTARGQNRLSEECPRRVRFTYLNEPTSIAATFAAGQCQTATYAWQQNAALFDHLVGERKQLVGDFEAKRFRGPEIDYEVKFRGLLDRQVDWLLAFENAASVVAG
jgi:hypothetical protein